MKREHRFQESLAEAPNRRGIKHDALMRKKKRRKLSDRLASVLLLYADRRFSNGGMLMSRLRSDSELRLITGRATQRTSRRQRVTASGPPDTTLGLGFKCLAAPTAGRPPTREASRPYANELAAHPQRVCI